MMDLKDIIKWFIPGFNISKRKFTKMDIHLTLCLFLFCNCPSFAAKLPSDSIVYISDNSITNNTKKFTFSHQENNLVNDQSNKLKLDSTELIEDTSVGRTFGRPFKKMIQAFIPLAFNLGMASTWAVVAALVGIKTLGVALIILKLLLVAGAAKIGAFFAQKVHSAPVKWEPQKEIHLHIHNDHHDEESLPIGPWNREGQTAVDSKHTDLVFNPYAGPQPINNPYVGPQTISTPYGTYVRVDPGHPVPGQPQAN